MRIREIFQNSRDPIENIKRTINFCRYSATFVGMNVLDKNFRPNIMTGLVFAWTILYPVFTFLTIKQEFSKNWKISLEALCMASTVFQGIVKFNVYLWKRKEIAETCQLIRDLYKQYAKMGPRYCSALNFSSDSTKFALKIAFITGIIPGFGIMITPVLTLLWNSNNRYLMVQFYIPGIDVHTWNGYLMTMGVHGTLMFVGAFGIYAADSLVLVYLLQSIMFGQIMKLKIEDLNNLLCSGINEIEAGKVEHDLKDMVKWQQLYSRFTDNCNEIFFYPIAVVVTTSGISLVLTLFMILTADWPGAYPYSIVCLYTLYIYCIMGTRLEICNDEFTNEIYNVAWYEMRPKQRKMVLIMLMQSQSPKTITIAAVLDLSVETALRITKTSYSLFMMMLNFFG